MAIYAKETPGNHSKEKLVDNVCGGCEYCESKKTGIWGPNLSYGEFNGSLEKVNGVPSILMRKNGSNGSEHEMVAMVPVEAGDLHRYISSIQAKQKMETCAACSVMLKEIAEGKIPVSDDFSVA